MNHSENSGVSYYRIWQQSKALKKLGHKVHDFPDNLPVMSIAEWEVLCKDADIFVTQKSDNPQLLALLMAVRDEYNIPVVFEIDDDIYDISKNSPAYQYFYPGSPFITMTEMVMQNVDAMTVSTQALADLYSKHCKNIYVLPNCQDPEDWDNLTTIKGKKQDQIVIGWAGSATHYDDLKIIQQPIKKLLRNYPNVTFRVLGCLPDFLSGIERVELRNDWSPIREWQSKLTNMGFDIGIIPVGDRPFNRGKSNIKWQEYSMLGIPTIASKVGEYKQIKHGIDGLLSENTQESWYYNLEKLVKDEALRRKMGALAKQRVLSDFDITKNIDKWDTVYGQIIRDFHS